MKEVEFIIVGAGIAGALMACEVIRRGHSCVVFDDPDSSGSSDVAAGSINPITGRFFVKS